MRANGHSGVFSVALTSGDTVCEQRNRWIWNYVTQSLRWLPCCKKKVTTEIRERDLGFIEVDVPCFSLSPREWAQQDSLEVLAWPRLGPSCGSNASWTTLGFVVTHCSPLCTATDLVLLGCTGTSASPVAATCFWRRILHRTRMHDTAICRRH